MSGVRVVPGPPGQKKGTQGRGNMTASTHQRGVFPSASKVLKATAQAAQVLQVLLVALDRAIEIVNHCVRDAYLAGDTNPMMVVGDTPTGDLILKLLGMRFSWEGFKRDIVSDYEAIQKARRTLKKRFRSLSTQARFDALLLSTRVPALEGGRWSNAAEVKLVDSLAGNCLRGRSEVSCCIDSYIAYIRSVSHLSAVPAEIRTLVRPILSSMADGRRMGVELLASLGYESYQIEIFNGPYRLSPPGEVLRTNVLRAESNVLG